MKSRCVRSFWAWLAYFLFFSFTFTFSYFHSVSANVLPLKDQRLGLTPAMGWNSWNKFGCKINQEVILKTIDAMVDSGMKAAGYQYVIIDDCWQASKRDGEGKLQADPVRFPHGIKYLADYAHDRGLKFGIYSDAGSLTCQGRPGSLGSEEIDAQTFAEWGVDYLKYDWCHTGLKSAPELYTKMAQALMNSGRPIYFAICNWGRQMPWQWGPAIAHSWRTTSDILNHWLSVLFILNKNNRFAQYAGPGHWNDPDMLEVGNGHLNRGQEQTHFALWSLMAAPLIAGNDLAAMDETTRELLTNREMIQINQDSLGIQGKRIDNWHGVEVWTKPLSPLVKRDGVEERLAVVLFNPWFWTKKDQLALARLKISPVSSDLVVTKIYPEKLEGEIYSSKDSLGFELRAHHSQVYLISWKKSAAIPQRILL